MAASCLSELVVWLEAFVKFTWAHARLFRRSRACCGTLARVTASALDECQQRRACNDSTLSGSQNPDQPQFSVTSDQNIPQISAKRQACFCLFWKLSCSHEICINKRMAPKGTGCMRLWVLSESSSNWLCPYLEDSMKTMFERDREVWKYHFLKSTGAALKCFAVKINPDDWARSICSRCEWIQQQTINSLSGCPQFSRHVMFVFWEGCLPPAFKMFSVWTDLKIEVINSETKQRGNPFTSLLLTENQCNWIGSC